MAAFPRDKPCAEYLSPECGCGCWIVSVFVEQWEREGARPLAGTGVRGRNGLTLCMGSSLEPAPLRNDRPGCP
jgi:hypothetical protein